MIMQYTRHPEYKKALKKKVPPGTYIFNGTWLSGRDFELNMNDPFVKELHKAQKLPLLIEKRSFGIILLIIFIVNALFNISYELTIPFFESTMDEASSQFMTIDDIVFYSQFAAAVIYGLIYILSSLKAVIIKRSWAEKTIEHYKELRQKDSAAFHNIIGKYLITCPHCGAPNDGDLTVCEYCSSEMRIF